MFSLFIFFSLIYIFQLFFFVSYTKNLKNKLFYNLIILILIYLIENVSAFLLIHFSYGRNFIFLLLENLQKNTILKDPQDFLYILVNTAGVLILIYMFLISIFLFHLFCVNVLRRFEYNVYTYILILYFGIFSGGLFIFFTDLITTHWEIFYQDKTFDFQPDLIRWYSYYKSEGFDFFIQLIFLTLVFMSLLIIFGKMNKSFVHSNLNGYSFCRMFLIFVLLIFSISFFGGESLWRDIILLFFCCIFCELIIFTLLFFKILKRFI